MLNLPIPRSGATRKFILRRWTVFETYLAAAIRKKRSFPSFSFPCRMPPIFKLTERTKRKKRAGRRRFLWATTVPARPPVCRLQTSERKLSFMPIRRIAEVPIAANAARRKKLAKYLKKKIEDDEKKKSKNRLDDLVCEISKM